MPKLGWQNTASASVSYAKKQSSLARVSADFFSLRSLLCVLCASARNALPSCAQRRRERRGESAEKAHVQDCAAARLLLIARRLPVRCVALRSPDGSVPGDLRLEIAQADPFGTPV